MFRMKQMAVSAVLLLVAASAMASNFRGADQVYMQVAGHVGVFASDVWVSNLSTADSVSVSIIYTPQGQGQAPQYFDNAFTLRPSERKEIIDFFPTILGLNSGIGSLIFNACKQGADCIGTQDDQGNSINFRDIAVFSRIYATQAGPPVQTNGQAFPGTPWYHFVSSRQSANGLGRVFVSGIRSTGVNNPRQPGTYRTNIGLMNASQYSTTTIVVKLFNGSTAQQIGSDFSFVLGPLNSVQSNVSTMFSAFAPGATSTNAYVTIEQTANVPTNDAPATCLPDGCPGFLAFGSVLDNQNDAPTTLETVYEKGLSGPALDAIYGTASVPKSNIRRAVKRAH